MTKFELCLLNYRLLMFNIYKNFQKSVCLKKSLTAFYMKVTTTPRDYCKGNQIVPIMQEHLGSVMNLARIKLQAFVLHAMCVWCRLSASTR